MAPRSVARPSRATLVNLVSAVRVDVAFTAAGRLVTEGSQPRHGQRRGPAGLIGLAASLAGPGPRRSL